MKQSNLKSYTLIKQVNLTSFVGLQVNFLGEDNLRA